MFTHAQASNNFLNGGLMKLVNQLLIFAANQPGVLANICGSLTDQQINIFAISVLDHADHALVRMVVDDTTKAVHLLGEAGLPVEEDQVISLPLSTGPGSLEKVANILAEAGLNIHYAYASESGGGDHNTNLILKTSDDTKALHLIREKFDKRI